MLTNCPPALIEEAKEYTQDVIDHCDPWTRMVLSLARKKGGKKDES